MKAFIPMLWLLVSLALSSCYYYQYITLSSPLDEHDTNEFIHENDSLKIIYKIHGENGPLQIQLENKLSKPLFIDLKQSSIIRNNQSRSLWEDLYVINGQAETTTRTTGETTALTDISARMKREESVYFIPPQSFHEVTLSALESEIFTVQEPKTKYRTHLSTPYGRASAYRYEYQKNNTPKIYRCYLTLSTAPSFKETIVVQNIFWVTEIIETDTTPSILLNGKVSTDKFYIKNRY